MVKRLRRRPLTAKTGVRVPVGLPKKRAQVKPVHAFLVLPARKANHARTKSRAEPHLPYRASVRVRAQRELCANGASPPVGGKREPRPHEKPSGAAPALSGVGSRSSAARTLRQRRKPPRGGQTRTTPARKAERSRTCPVGRRFAFERSENFAPKAQDPRGGQGENHARTKSRAEPHLPYRASVRVRAQRELCAPRGCCRAGRKHKLFSHPSTRTASRTSSSPIVLPPPSTTAICGSSARFTSICSACEK